MKQLLKSFWADESGQGLTEYALILALVSVALVTVLVIFRNAIGNVIDNVIDALQDNPTNGEYTSVNTG